MPELTMTIEVPSALLGHAILLVTRAGFVADPAQASGEGNLSVRIWDDDGDGDSQQIHHDLVIEALTSGGVPATIRSAGVVIGSGKWAGVLVDGEEIGLRVIGQNDDEFRAQLLHVSEVLGIELERLRVDLMDDPYRELLGDD